MSENAQGVAEGMCKRFRIKQSTFVRAGFVLMGIAAALVEFAPMYCLPVGVVGGACFLWGARKYPYE